MSDKLLKNEEEFNNFMHKVTEVESIVKKLSSSNRTLNNMGMLEADRLLNDPTETVCEKIDDKTIELKITNNRTMINKFKDVPKQNENEMDPEVFMKEIEKDAKKRYEDKKVRKEKSDTLKLRANMAFRRGEYEVALSLYIKAIELIKDSCVLYTNRALTYIRLELYEQAEKDCEIALRLNENSMKAWLLRMKIAYETQNNEKYYEYLNEAITRHPTSKAIIENFVNSMKSSDEEIKI